MDKWKNVLVQEKEIVELPVPSIGFYKLEARAFVPLKFSFIDEDGQEYPVISSHTIVEDGFNDQFVSAQLVPSVTNKKDWPVIIAYRWKINPVKRYDVADPIPKSVDVTLVPKQAMPDHIKNHIAEVLRSHGIEPKDAEELVDELELDGDYEFDELDEDEMDLDSPYFDDDDELRDSSDDANEDSDDGDGDGTDTDAGSDEPEPEPELDDTPPKVEA